MYKIQVACVKLSNLVSKFKFINTNQMSIHLFPVMHIFSLQGYRYKVANGVKVIMIKLAKYFSSQMNIAGHRALGSYDGQPVTCYGCGDIGRVNQACSKRRGEVVVTSDSTPNTWAHVAAKCAQNWNGNDDNRIEVIPQNVPHDQASGCSPSVDDLKTTDVPLDIGGEQQDPTHQRRHDLKSQVKDAPCRRYNMY